MDAINYDLTDEQLRAIYAWIDAIPLSRPKRNIGRDFGDGVMLAEVIAAYFPHLVELHNYPAANSTKQKIYNHETLNQRVLKKLGFTIPRGTIEDIVNCKAGVIEAVLNTLQIKMAKYREKKQDGNVSNSPAENRHVSNYSNQNNEYHNISDESKHQNNKKVVENISIKKKIDTPTEKENKPINNKNNIKSNNNNNNPPAAGVNQEILFEKEQQIRELQETVEILELKIAKLEQLVRLKDNKIQKLLSK